MQRFRLTVLAAATAVLLAACGGSGANPSIDPADADVTVTAADLAFEPGTVAVAGGDAVTIAFVNEDTMPHNIAIYTDESRSQKLFEGAIVTDDTVVYDIPALDPGEYFFDCSLHPEMTGTLVVEG